MSDSWKYEGPEYASILSFFAANWITPPVNSPSDQRMQKSVFSSRLTDFKVHPEELQPSTC